MAGSIIDTAFSIKTLFSFFVTDCFKSCKAVDFEVKENGVDLPGVKAAAFALMQKKYDSGKSILESGLGVIIYFCLPLISYIIMYNL